MRFYLSLYLFLAAVYLFTASGRLGLSDGVAMYNVSQSIVTDGSLSSEPCDPNYEGHPNHCVPGRNGRYYAGFGLVPSLLATPAVLTGRLFSAILHVTSSQVPRVLVSLLTALIAPLTCLVLAAWIIQLGYSKRTALFSACILGLASPYWHFGVKGFYSEPYFTLLLVLAAYLLSRRDLALAAGLSGLAFGAACGSRVNGVILFPAFIITIALQTRERGWTMKRFLRDALYFSATFSICAMLIGWANYARFGSPLKTGYHLAYPTASALLSNPLPQGISELLFSGEVGLLVFAPWLIVALLCCPLFTREHRPESVFCGTVFLFNLIFFAKYDSWHGGWVAGPRLLAPTLPFLIMAMAAGIEKSRRAGAVGGSWKVLRPLAVTFVTAAFLIQIMGVIYPEERFYTLAEFYQQRTEQPWWAGSILLASMDFLRGSSGTKTKSTQLVESRDSDPLRVLHGQQNAYASMTAASGEENFLNSFPNSENLFLPNLMLWKMKYLGLPVIVLYGYLTFVVMMGVAGLVGLLRYSALAGQ